MRQSTTTKEEIIGALQTAGAERGRWWTTREWKTDGRTPSFSVIRAQFGTWRAAWAVAGYAMGDPWKNRRFAPRGTWSHDSILAVMQEQADVDRMVPSGSLWQRQHNRPSLLTIQRHFGSYAAAVAQAGLTIRRRRVPEEELWGAYHTLTDQLGYTAQRSDWDRWPERPCSSSHVWLRLDLTGISRDSGLYTQVQQLDLAAIYSPRDARIIQRYQHKDTAQVIARDLHISRQRVYQVLHRWIDHSSAKQDAVAEKSG